MTWQTALLVLVVVLWAAAQYGLAAHALLDLRRRPTVRGNNKVVWTLVILGLPIAGALIYTVYGPTSFIRRGPALTHAPLSTGRPGIYPLPPDASNTSGDRLPDEAAPRRHRSRINRAETRIHHAQAIERLPELPELAELDGEIAEEYPAPLPRRAAQRLLREAQRKIRR
jgi:hypothetical protein